MDRDMWSKMLDCALAAQNTDSSRIIKSGIDVEAWLMENPWKDSNEV